MHLRPQSLAFTVLLGALAALPPLSIDMGLPALPLLERGLGAAPGQAALTLSLFLLGFAPPQLLMGPLSDRIGRRPVLLAGLAVYALAGLGCALAPSMGWLLVLRVLQGMGAAAGTVLAFAMVRDVFQGPLARIKLSSITMVFSVAPMIAPMLGGLMLRLGGWQAIYWLLGVTGALLLAVVVVALPETRPAAPGAGGLGLLARYETVLRQRRCVGHVATTALNFGTLFSFVACSPMVLMGDLGVSVTVFGALFAVTSFGILAGSWCNARLTRRGIDGEATMDSGLRLSLAAGVAASAPLAPGLLSLATLLPFVLAVSFCRGLVGPNAMHAVLEPVPEHAGAASALVGCAQTLMGGLAGAVVALLYPALGPLGMTLAMAMFAAAALLARRYAEGPGPGLMLARPGQ